MKSFLPALFLAALIPAANASTILGGSANFDLTGDDAGIGLYRFSMPFLYGTQGGSNSAFGLFGMEVEARGSRPFPDFNFVLRFADEFTASGAISRGKYTQNVTVQPDYAWFYVDPFEFDPTQLRVEVPLSFSIDWHLKNAAGRTLDYISATGNGMAILQLDSAFKLISGSFNFSPSTDDINNVNNPEPGTLLLFSTGVGLIAWAKRRKAKKAVI